MPTSAFACALGRRLDGVLDRFAAARSRTVALCTLALAITPLSAALVGDLSRAADHLAATSSRSARHDAVRKIPFDALGRDDQTAVRSVIRRACLFRRLPTKVIDCDPDLFDLLIRNPHVVANTWEVLGLSKLRMNRLNDTTFQADDGNGTRGTLRILWADYGEEWNKVLLFGEGTYEGKPFVRPVRAQSVMLLQSGAVRESNGRTLITARLDTFVQVEQIGVDLLARTFHPLVGKAADHNFVETMRFVGNFSHTAERNPAGIERLAKRLRKVEPDTRHELVRLAFDLSDRRDQDDPVPPARMSTRPPERRNVVESASSM